MKMLTATVSHDVMTPLLTIKSFVDTIMKLAKKGDIEGVEKYSRLIQEIVQIIGSKTKDLLDHHMIESGAFLPRLSEFSPRDALSSIVDIHES
jgi:K+-sensing histidine kinase KdpD